MGDLSVRLAGSQEDVNQFTRHLLSDIRALEYMLENDYFDRGQMKIGAEQEICLVDDHGKPAPHAMEVLRRLNHPSYTTELAKFNVEANMAPVDFKDDCFSQLEAQTHELLAPLKQVTKEMDLDYVLTGILPSLRKFDLTTDNLTPLDRYKALVRALRSLRGKEYELRIEGLDELNILHESAMLEACNTSFQVHLQVKPEEFALKYNIAQAIAGPVMSIASNSPMLFGKRLWAETRIALFRQSIDTRVASEHMRERSPRVMFGNDWVRKSLLELYREDIMRFRILLMTDVEEEAFETLRRGETPKLRALNVHNSTVYRWNRACYGINPDGTPHLRIENRIFPSGPTVVDEVANAAFWTGLMTGMPDEYPDIAEVMDFDDAKTNFIKAARSGLGIHFTWAKNKKVLDQELIREELIPLAKHGLQKAGVAQSDIDKYMGIIEARNETVHTGSRWMLYSFGKLHKETTREEAITAIISAMRQKQKENQPIHEWPLAKLEDITEWEPSDLLVEEFMDTDVITITKKDLPVFAADILNWRTFRYLPVEDEKGQFVGLISLRILLKHFSNPIKGAKELAENCCVEDIMIKNPYTIHPQANITEAMRLMRKHRIGCLPVVADGDLVGIITEANFLKITGSLLTRIAERRKRRKQLAQHTAEDSTMTP